MADEAVTLRVGTVEELVGGLLMTGETELLRRRNQIDRGAVFLLGYGVTGGASHGDGGVYMLSLCLAGMTSETDG
jgi:hypothetical protein